MHFIAVTERHQSLNTGQVLFKDQRDFFHLEAILTLPNVEPEADKFH